MNIYVVLLRKLVAMSPGDLYPHSLFKSMKLKEDILSSWVTLGHFDTMHAYSLPLEQQDLFGSIDRHSKALAAYRDQAGYSHPLYLISEENDQDFWQEDQPFAAVMRIHFAESIHVRSASEKIREALTAGRLAEANCQWRAYNTIELSDMILVVKGKSLKRIAGMALSLRRCAAVGKVYTYFGINTEAIKQPSLPQASEEDPEERIAWCSVRFSALDFQVARERAEQVKQLLGGTQTYSIVGVDDLMVTAPRVTTDGLVRLYHWCFFQARPADTDWSFADITTRLGIPLDEVGNSLDTPLEQGPPQSVQNLQKICSGLQNQSWNIYYRASAKNDPQNDWVSPLPKLSSILARMAHTPVLDEFVYLMLPGTQAFLANVNAHFDELSYADREMCRIFVECWTDLMEHVMRIEGQLTHHPELRPVLYDIPVFMLEYTLAFLWQVTRLLQQRDVEKRGDTAFLLVPRLCSHIQAQELYPAQSSTLPGLVLVTIPFQMLYRPEEVQLILAHEASHFVGEQTRCRDFRLECFIQSAAPLISKEVFGSASPAAVRGLGKSVNDYFQSLDKVGAPRNMEDIRLCLNAFLNRIAKDEDFFSDIVRQTLRNTGSADIYGVYSGDLVDMTPWAAKSTELSKWLDDLSTLYREVYADICMLALLPLGAERYAQSLLSEIPSDGHGRMQMTVRLYVCLRATDRMIPYQYIKKQNKALYQGLTEIENGKLPSNFFPLASIQPLEEYAHKCFQRVGQHLDGDDCRETVLKLRDAFQKISEKVIPYSHLIEEVDNYRIQLLRELSRQTERPHLI